jgi:cyclin-dependent kinase 7
LTLATELKTGRTVAIKKIKVTKAHEGFDFSSLREVLYLKKAKHPNVIEVRLN